MISSQEGTDERLPRAPAAFLPRPRAGAEGGAGVSSGRFSGAGWAGAWAAGWAAGWGRPSPRPFAAGFLGVAFGPPLTGGFGRGAACGAEAPGACEVREAGACAASADAA